MMRAVAPPLSRFLRQGGIFGTLSVHFYRFYRLPDPG
jgi:hypothetical protein